MAVLIAVLLRKGTKAKGQGAANRIPDDVVEDDERLKLVLRPEAARTNRRIRLQQHPIPPNDQGIGTGCPRAGLKDVQGPAAGGIFSFILPGKTF